MIFGVIDQFTENDYHYSNSIPYIYYNSSTITNRIQGTFFGGGKDNLLEWCELYIDELNLFEKFKVFAGKDQNIMSSIYMKYKYKFDIFIPREYNNKVNTGSCYITLTQISKTAGNDSEIMKLISNNSDLSNCDLVDKIAALNNTNRPKILDAINKCYGSKYGEVLNFVDTLKRLDVYSSNTNFATYVENSARTPVVSGSKSTVNMIQQYMDSMAVMNKVASINSAATSPAPTTKK